ncbi:MAG TPA: ATP-binding protein [Gemmatimonadales bacterium]
MAHCVSAFARDLAGTLRRGSIVELFIRRLQDTFAPSSVAVALDEDGRGEPDLHTWPAGSADAGPILAAAREGGARRIERSGAIWCVAPLTARGRVTGAVVIRDPAGPYAAGAPALLEALAGLVSVALESAHLVDLHDDGRRSWQEVVDALSLALCIVDREGRIRRANRAFAALVDAPPAALVGHPWAAFTPPDWSGELQRLIEARGEGGEVELETLERVFCVSAVPVSEGDTGNVVLLFDDHTERRRLQDKLVQSTKLSAMGQLVAGVAHELNNPLASVVGFADFLGEIPDVPPSLREPLNVIREEAERASTIVRNLLGFARKQERQRRPAALGPLIESTMALLRNPLMASRVDSRIEIEPALPPISIDANQVQQVLVNLVTNAAQAIASTGSAGTVTVRARRFLDELLIDVVDDGPGMAPEIAAQVFDPFFTTKPPDEGTGLGISISQGIVREHGGRITLETAPGQGATFTIHLPLHEGAPAPEPAPQVEPPATRLRVLVVDDEPHILHYMSATLAAWGHAVAVAEDGDEGLAAAASGEFDLVITDLRMPRMSGREFFESVRARNPAMAERIFFSTGDTVRGDTLAFLEMLERPFLHKPFGLAELRALLGAAIERLPPARPERVSFTVPTDDTT